MLITYNITIEECVKEKSFRNIYSRIISEHSSKSSVCYQNIHRLHYKCFPEHLKSFNYKLHFNLLPLNFRFHVYSLDNDSRCYFCKWGPENEWHLFGNCEKLSPLWELLDETVIFAFNTPYSFSINRKDRGDIDLVNSSCYRELEIPLSHI